MTKTITLNENEFGRFAKVDDRHYRAPSGALIEVVRTTRRGVQIIVIPEEKA